MYAFIVILTCLLSLEGCRKDHKFPDYLSDQNYANGHPLVRSTADANLMDLEQQLVDQTNALRVSYGMPALLRNAALDGVARAHSIHMIIHDFYGHVNPEGDGPTDRLRRVTSVPFSLYENVWAIALGQPISDAVTAFMNSPEHRDAMLSDSDLIGVGLWEGVRPGVPVDQIYITMEFVKLY